MSTDTATDDVDAESSLLSWETWDRTKHTERFIWAASILFVLLFSWTFSESPVISGFLQGYHGLATGMLVWAIFALGFNLLLGQTGLLSFGHAMFWGGAGYAGALFAIHVHADPFLTVIAGVAFALVLAFVSGLVLLRLHSVYFAIVTLAIAQLLYGLAREPLEPITEGINGLSPSFEPLFGVFALRRSFGGFLGFLGDGIYVFVGVFFVAVVALIARIRKSPYGLIFKAIRENETRARFVGLDVWRYKFAAYMQSALISGLAGVLMVIHTNFIPPLRLYWEVSGNVVVMTVLGGLGTLAGPVIGAFVFFWFEGILDGIGYVIPGLEFLGPVGQYWLLLLAIAFTAVVWAYPDGIWGMITDVTAALRDPRTLLEKATRKIPGLGSGAGTGNGDEDGDDQRGGDR